MSTQLSPAPITVGMVLFPDLTQLDLTGPYEVFSRLPDTTVYLLAETPAPVRSERGLTIIPDATFDQAPPLDVLCVPGGLGVNRMIEHEPLLRFLHEQGQRARYVTAVCTGSLLLAAAGLLQGYRATTHWMSLELLELFGVQPVAARVFKDRNRITGGGVTAGIDFGLAVAAELRGDKVAQQIQLLMEYDPAPPFASGSPQTAPAEVVAALAAARGKLQETRRAIVQRAVARLQQAGSQD